MLENSKLRFIRYAMISVLILIMISAVNPFSLGYTRRSFPSIEEIIYESDCIVHGRVVDAYMGDPPHRWVYYKVEIYEIIYDDKETNIIESGETGHVVFTIPGGNFRGVPKEKLKPELGLFDIAGMPGFQIGEELILFLREYKTPDSIIYISIINSIDGFMKVEEKDGGKMLTRNKRLYLGLYKGFGRGTEEGIKPEEFIKQIHENIEKIKSNPEYDFKKRIEREEREKKDNRDKASYPPSSRNHNPMGPPFPLKPGDENKKIIIKSADHHSPPPQHTHFLSHR